MADPANTLSEEIAAAAAHAAFGKPLVTNVHRGLIAEAIVATALGPDWRWCSSDYSAWDFERSDGVRLEVKQAAALQTWHAPADRPSRIAFDIAIRVGRYDGAAWFADRRRWADLYVFAHHHVHDTTLADHRDPSQWNFYVVSANRLPDQKSLALSRIRSIAICCDFAQLPSAVETVYPSP